MEQMALNNAIGPYYETTQEFVDELQNYLKIAKVCANDKLEECFGYDKLLLSNGEEFELAEIKSGENLGKTADNTEYLETVGLVTIDGTGMILSWDKKCPILEPKVYAWGNNTNETTSCVAAIMDINLDKSPNRIGKDIARFRAETPTKSQPVCGMQFGDNCWGTPFVPTPLTKAECQQVQGINECYYDNDYWAGAYKQCQDEGKHLPTQAELKAFAQYLYGTQNILEDGQTSNLNLNTNTLSNLPEAISTAYNAWLPNKFAIWSGVERNDSTANCRTFYADRSTYGYTGRSNNYLGVCVW